MKNNLADDYENNLYSLTMNKVENFYNQHPYGRAWVDQELEFTRKLKGKKILDAGCGAGVGLFRYILAGAEVTGVDISVKSIAFISSWLEKLQLRHVALLKGNLENIDLPQAEYDLIFSQGVLHHAENPEKIMENFARWIKPNGEIHILLYHRYSLENLQRLLFSKIFPIIEKLLPFGFLSRREWWDKYAHPLWRTYTIRELRALCKTSGLRIVEAYYTGSVIGSFLEFASPPILTRAISRLFSKRFGWHLKVVLRP